MIEKAPFLYYDEKAKKITEKIDEEKYIGLGKPLERLDLYLYAMALGRSFPTKLSKKETLIRGEYVDKRVEAIPLIAALYVGGLDFIELDKISFGPKMYEYSDECANTGFKIIETEINKGSLENLELNIIKDLDNLYDENVIRK